MLPNNYPFFYEYIIRPNFINRGYLLPKLREYFDVENKLILDFGCGTGCNSFMFDYQFYTGVDVDSNRIQFARKIHPQYKFLVNHPGHMLPFTNESFDYIFICGVLHHLDDATCSAYSEEFKRILAANGKVIIMEPHLVKWNLLCNFVMKLFDHGQFMRSFNDYLEIFSHHFSVKYKTDFSTPNFYNTILISLELRGN